MSQQPKLDLQSRPEPNAPTDYREKSVYVRFLLLGFFVATLITVAATLGAELTPLISVITGINGAALFLCGFDKSIAPGKAARVPEVVLFAFALFGGSPGLLIGMLFFRHKTRSSSFILRFAVVFLLQLLFLRLATMS